MAVVFEYRYNRKKKGTGITGMGLVEKPAIEKGWKLHMSKESEPSMKLLLDKSARVITGPIAVPNIKIYRSAESLGLDTDGYIFFTKETIKKMFEDWMEGQKVNQTTLNHESDISGCSLVEAWLVIDPEKDKSAALGMPQTIGTAMASYKIHNDEVLAKIESGELTGFSIEADGLERVQMTKEETEEFPEIMSDELATLTLKHLKDKGQTLEQLEAEGWELIKELPTELLELGIESTASEPSKLDRKKYQVRYAYKLKPEHQGDNFIIETSRNFCKEVHAANLWYREEDIEQATNPDFGTYDIRKWVGGWNCRHMWEKNYFSKSMKFSSEEPSEDEIAELIKEKLTKLLFKTK